MQIGDETIFKFTVATSNITLVNTVDELINYIIKCDYDSDNKDIDYVKVIGKVHNQMCNNLELYKTAESNREQWLQSITSEYLFDFISGRVQLRIRNDFKNK